MCVCLRVCLCVLTPQEALRVGWNVRLAYYNTHTHTWPVLCCCWQGHVGLAVLSVSHVWLQADRWLLFRFCAHYISGKNAVGVLVKMAWDSFSGQDSWHWLIIGDGNRGRACCWQEVRSHPALGGGGSRGFFFCCCDILLGEICTTQRELTGASKTCLSVNDCYCLCCHAETNWVFQVYEVGFQIKSKASLIFRMLF